MHDAGGSRDGVIYLTADEAEDLRKRGYEFEPAPPELEVPLVTPRRFTLEEAVAASKADPEAYVRLNSPEGRAALDATPAPIVTLTRGEEVFRGIDQSVDDGR